MATAGDAETHGPEDAAAPEPVNCEVAPIQILSFPVIVGAAETVTVAVLVHPPMLVKVITLVPAETPVTNPLALTVATAGVPETHGFVVVDVPEPASWVVEPAHTVRVPVMAGIG